MILPVRPGQNPDVQRPPGGGQGSLTLYIASCMERWES
jgi:hypothetical protein